MPQFVLRLEVINGPLKGQVAVVPDQGTLVVGRLPECGLSIPQDLTVSRQHFRIEYRSAMAELIHLSQTGETLVNGIPVTTVELREGDEIAFGDGNKILVVFEDTRDGIGKPTSVPARMDDRVSDSPKEFTSKTASCGWNLYESAGEQPDFATLLSLLIESQTVNCLADFRRLGVPVPTDVEGLEYLFPWMPEGVREQFSPVLLPVSEHPKVAEMIGQGFGKDATVIFGSKLKGKDLVAHWRKAVGCDGDKPGSSVTAYYWPSILSLILTCQSSDQLAPLLSQLLWIFVEEKKSAGQWRLFARDDFSRVLSKSGLVLAETPTKSK